MPAITQIQDLVEALGGAAAMAKWAGYEDARGVYNWSARGVPPAYHLRIALLAIRRGVHIDPSIFDLPEEDGEVLARLFSASEQT